MTKDKPRPIVKLRASNDNHSPLTGRETPDARLVSLARLMARGVAMEMRAISYSPPPLSANDNSKDKDAANDTGQKPDQIP